MTEIKWIKITTDIFDDEKILLIETLPEADSIIVIWFKLLCLAGKQNNSGVFMMNGRIAYTDEMFATIFRRKLTIIQLALNTFEQFGMIELINNAVTIPNWSKHQNFDQIEKKTEYQREYMRGYREKQKQLASVNDCKTNSKTNGESNSKANVSSLDKIRVDKIREENIYTPSKMDVEAIWSLYPLKQGRATAIKKIPQLLKTYGMEQMERCINRYIDYVDKRRSVDFPDLKYKNGSTFFNAGYVDFLDDNYDESMMDDIKPLKNNKSNNYMPETSPERQKVYEEMEVTQAVDLWPDLEVKA